MPMNEKCLGCRTYFQENEILQNDESLTVEYKNYRLPVEQAHCKWILLKTITGFMNSKGGTIYIGVRDDGLVVGIEAIRKKQDEFKLEIKFLVERIHPRVDLTNKEELIIQFVPVVKDKVFCNRYVGKIIVKQGDPSRTYHFSQKISMEGKQKTEELEIFKGFYRHSLGGVEGALQGQPLLEEIYRKCKNPSEISNTFHKQCNPDPLKLEALQTKIGFGSIRKDDLRKLLEERIKLILDETDVQYEVTYDIDSHVVLLDLDSNDQFNNVKAVINSKLPIINAADPSFKFVERGVYLDFFLYKNIFRETEQISIPNAEKSQKSEKTSIPEVAEVTSPLKLPNKQVESVEEDQIALKRTPSELSKEKISLNEIIFKNKLENCTLIFTHLKKQAKQELAKYLSTGILPNIQIKTSVFKNAVEAVFCNQTVMQEYFKLLKVNPHSSFLNSCGINNVLIYGINTNIVSITGYDHRRRKQLLEYVRKLFDAELVSLEYRKVTNKYFLSCEFKDSTATCKNLDKLIDTKDIYKFNCPGATAEKALRIFIYCIFN